MGVKVATNSFQWSQPIISHSPPSSQTISAAISSPSSKRLCRSDVAGPLVCRYVHGLDRVAVFGAPTKLQRIRSCECPKPRARTIKRACSASLDAFSDEEFSENIQEMVQRFQLSEDENTTTSNPAVDSESKELSNSREIESSEESSNSVQLQSESLLKFDVDIPVSLGRMREEGFGEAGGLAYCSVKKAFSSMVFIIRELHSYTLQLREFLFTEDLRGILSRVQQEMHASFVWLFQQVFSHTPTLMVYVMLLLANFTVYSMTSTSAIAVSPPTATNSVSVVEIQDQKDPNFDSALSLKTFSVSSSGSKSTSIGGNNGGGGKIRPVARGTDGDGWSDRSEPFRTIVPDGASQLSSFMTTMGTEESVSGQEIRDGDDEELRLWNSVVDEASRMEAEFRDEALDHETMKRFVSPITVEVEADDYADYLRTELMYQTRLAQEPSHPLLLANYAQFLYLIAHDYDRAEEYFKRAIGVEMADAESYSKYAVFLWRVRKDLWAAEETFLEAISADPTNSYYASNYAHFLWNTGGDDTCFPLTSPDNTQEVV